MDEVGELRKPPLSVKEAKRHFIGASAAPQLKGAILEELLRRGEIQTSTSKSKEEIKEDYYGDQERPDSCFRAYLVALGPSRRSFLGRPKTKEQIEEENRKRRARLEKESQAKFRPEIIDPLHDLAIRRKQSLGDLLLEAGSRENETLTKIVEEDHLSRFGLKLNDLINEVRQSTKAKIPVVS